MDDLLSDSIELEYYTRPVVDDKSTLSIHTGFLKVF